MTKNPSFYLCATFIMTLGSTYAVAGDARNAEVQDTAAIKKSLEARYPDIPVVDIHSSPIPGLYEVFSANGVVFVDRTGQYLIAGPMIAVNTKTDLSQEALDQRGAIKFEQLPFDQAIKTVRGSGERTLAVFADPDCPFCHSLEKELAGLNDVTIYTFLYPLIGVHPDARNKSHALWCAPDRGAAWHAWMILDQGAPVPAANCTQDPVDDLLALGAKLHIDSTPVVFLADGHRVSGVRTAAQLDALMNKSLSDKPRSVSNVGH